MQHVELAIPPHLFGQHYVLANRQITLVVRSAARILDPGLLLHQGSHPSEAHSPQSISLVSIRYIASNIMS